MDIRRAKKAYRELLNFKGGTITDFQGEAELVELDFDSEHSRMSWSVLMRDLFSFLDVDEDENLEDTLRDSIAQGLEFEEFLGEIMINERIAA